MCPVSAVLMDPSDPQDLVDLLESREPSLCLESPDPKASAERRDQLVLLVTVVTREFLDLLETLDPRDSLAMTTLDPLAPLDLLVLRDLLATKETADPLVCPEALAVWDLVVPRDPRVLKETPTLLVATETLDHREPWDPLEFPDPQAHLVLTELPVPRDPTAARDNVDPKALLAAKADLDPRESVVPPESNSLEDRLVLLAQLVLPDSKELLASLALMLHVELVVLLVFLVMMAALAPLVTRVPRETAETRAPLSKDVLVIPAQTDLLVLLAWTLLAHLDVKEILVSSVCPVAKDLRDPLAASVFLDLQDPMDLGATQESVGASAAVSNRLTEYSITPI